MHQLIFEVAQGVLGQLGQLKVGLRTQLEAGSRLSEAAGRLYAEAHTVKASNMIACTQACFYCESWSPSSEAPQQSQK